ncbi:hypothetical protein OPV22_022509 [Ensete ventricosum]|uniref:Uncharacterized protein n=1 Tax=Ensete ventricosum TaxID=4639 RepID=A0AAV8QJR7_ENSVE|nr:hypothetical protein OPV22_022509 [Ensete ventricosum]
MCRCRSLSLRCTVADMGWRRTSKRQMCGLQKPPDIYQQFGRSATSIQAATLVILILMKRKIKLVMIGVCFVRGQFMFGDCNFRLSVLFERSTLCLSTKFPLVTEALCDP